MWGGGFEHTTTGQYPKKNYRYGKTGSVSMPPPGP
jgi:hypothetical protein